MKSIIAFAIVFTWSMILNAHGGMSEGQPPIGSSEVVGSSGAALPPGQAPAQVTDHVGKAEVETALSARTFGAHIGAALNEATARRLGRPKSSTQINPQDGATRARCEALFINEKGELGTAGRAVMSAFDRYPNLGEKLLTSSKVREVLNRYCPKYGTLKPYQQKVYMTWILGGVSAFEYSECNERFDDGRRSRTHRRDPMELAGLLPLSKDRRARQSIPECTVENVQDLDPNVACALGMLAYWGNRLDHGLTKQGWFGSLRRDDTAEAILRGFPLCTDTP